MLATRMTDQLAIPNSYVLQASLQVAVADVEIGGFSAKLCGRYTAVAERQAVLAKLLAAKISKLCM